MVTKSRATQSHSKRLQAIGKNGRGREFEPPTPGPEPTTDVLTCLPCLGLFCVLYPRFAWYSGVNGPQLDPIPHGSFGLDALHGTPLEVQHSCIADGVQAATGVSVTKLNLPIKASPMAQMETILRSKAVGKKLVFRVRPETVSRFLNQPHAQLEQAVRQVMSLIDDRLFSVEILK